MSRPPLVLEPLGIRGEAIFPAFEGWGPDKSGENVLLLLGYYNRNKTQELVIPIGPDNRIEPDGPDYGQPTHFYTGRQHGVFAIKVPKDFGNKRLTWSITANGQTSTISFWVNPAYWVNFYKHAANSNEPPVISLTRGGPTLTGPPLGITQTISRDRWPARAADGVWPPMCRSNVRPPKRSSPRSFARRTPHAPPWIPSRSSAAR